MCGEIEPRVKEIVESYARLSVKTDTLRPEDDLFGLGMTSHATVNVMLALEDAFGIEFPEDLLRRETFESVAAMAAAVSGLTGPSLLAEPRSA